MPAFNLPRRLVAEGLGTALLVAVVVGSGIMGERLAKGTMRWRFSATRSPRARRWSC
jgi:glycerol uptake facilitator-like aquaporin